MFSLRKNPGQGKSPLDDLDSYCPACDQEQALLGVIPASPAHLLDSLALDCGHAITFSPTDQMFLRAKANGSFWLYLAKADLLRVRRREGKE